jgi:hypothetical protein
VIYLLLRLQIDDSGKLKRSGFKMLSGHLVLISLWLSKNGTMEFIGAFELEGRGPLARPVCCHSNWGRDGEI